MKRFALFALTAVLMSLGCAESEEQNKSEGFNIEFPGGNVRINDGSVDVKAPGVDVNVDREKVDVNAPGVGVQVEKGQKVGVQAPGVDVDVERGGDN